MGHDDSLELIDLAVEQLLLRIQEPLEGLRRAPDVDFPKSVGGEILLRLLHSRFAAVGSGIEYRDEGDEKESMDLRVGEGEDGSGSEV